jgi:N-acyl-D-aspartate/D-glutamate deacylase
MAMNNPSVTACELVIANATVIDGSGRDGYVADVVINNGCITHIGNSENFSPQHLIDATGLVLSPGFIDTHTHDDWALLETPQMPCKISQGVTTVVTGNCGVSATPFTPNANLPDPFKLVPGMSKYAFSGVTDYALALQRSSPAVNVRMLIGHSSLRATVMGADLERKATKAEIARMCALLEQALREGAGGLSSGLDYNAALAAEQAELVALAEVVAKYDNKVYTTHVRDEGDEVVAAVEEALTTAKQARAPLILSHHKCAGKANFGKSKITLKMVDQALADQRVALDVYPYTASSTVLSQRFLSSADKIIVTWSKPYPEFNGMLLDDISKHWRIDRVQACERLLPAGAIYFDMHEDDLARIVQHPLSMIGSDGLPGTPNPHPRLWGTFPRVIRKYVRQHSLLSLAQAIHKMTGLAANQFGLQKRGVVAAGFAADIVVFDPEKIADVADFTNPEVASTGIHHVLVNGKFALSDGQLYDCRAGKLLTE